MSIDRYLQLILTYRFAFVISFHFWLFTLCSGLCVSSLWGQFNLWNPKISTVLYRSIIWTLFSLNKKKKKRIDNVIPNVMVISICIHKVLAQLFLVVLYVIRVFFFFSFFIFGIPNPFRRLYQCICNCSNDT